jgi:muramoyltetrapeptide carboxypeptidase
LKPKAIGLGSLIGVAAPASPVRKEFIEAGIAELERLGFRARLGKNVYQRGRYTAGSAEERLRDWIDLWDDPAVDALFCARGGYGSMDLLPHLSPERARENPKVVIGSSDVTALLQFLMSGAGVVSFHGPMVAQQIAGGDYDSRNLLAVLGSTSVPAERACRSRRDQRRHEATVLLVGSPDGRPPSRGWRHLTRWTSTRSGPSGCRTS